MTATSLPIQPLIIFCPFELISRSHEVCFEQTCADNSTDHPNALEKYLWEAVFLLEVFSFRCMNRIPRQKRTNMRRATRKINATASSRSSLRSYRSSNGYRSELCSNSHRTTALFRKILHKRIIKRS